MTSRTSTTLITAGVLGGIMLIASAGQSPANARMQSHAHHMSAATVHVHPSRNVFVHHRRHHRHFRSFAFVDAPIVAYDSGCGWLRHKAIVTGSRYWWHRYHECIGY